MDKLRRVLVGLALFGLVAGCAGIPTSGPVISSDSERTDQVNARPYVWRAPTPPVPGSDPAVLLEDFLRSSVTYASDVKTVREYLTPAEAKDWEPSNGVTVTVKRPEVEVAADGSRVTLTYTAIATTDANGVYTPVAHAQRKSETQLELSKVNGEWRIANLPDGVIMSESDFDIEFLKYYRYFFDPGFNVLVPEPVYLAQSGNIETLLAKSLLSGPSSWLEPAVETAFPDGTELAVPSVPVASDGTADVELASDGSTINADRREQMAAQLAWTLAQSNQRPGRTNVMEVNATLDGGPLLTDPLVKEDFADSEYSAGRDSNLYALDGRNRVVVVPEGGDQSVPVNGPFGSPTDAVEFAVDDDGSQIVALSEDRTQVLHAAREEGAELKPIATGSDMSSLDWDRTGRIWMLDDDGTGAELRAMRSDGSPEDVAVRGRASDGIEALSVSPDGTKMAIVIDGAAYAGIIVPSKGGADVTNLVPISVPGTVLDVAWSDATTVALLAEESNEAPESYLVELSSREVTSLGSLHPTVAPGAVSIAAASPENVVVGTLGEAEDGSDDQIWANNGPAQWTRLDDGSVPAFPG